MHLTIVGCGSLGAALLQSALKTEIVKRSDLLLIERNAKDREDLYKHFEVSVEENLPVKAKQDEVILLSIKPKDLANIGAKLSEYVAGSSALVISSLAGVSIARLQERLSGYTNVVRVMPNLGVQVELGVTGIYCPKAINEENRNKVKNLFSACGIVIPVENEPQLDVVTAISGSGPAYFCAFLEALEATAIANGMPEADARKSLLQTLVATAKILEAKGVSPAELREHVTSPGGVTQSALQVLKSKNFDEMMSLSIGASIARSKELDKLA